MHEQSKCKLPIANRQFLFSVLAPFPIEGLGAGTANSTPQQKPEFIRVQIRAFKSRNDTDNEFIRFGIIAIVAGTDKPIQSPDAYDDGVASAPLRLALGALSIRAEIYNSEEVPNEKQEISKDFCTQFHFSVKRNADTPLKAGAIFGQLHIQQKDQYPKLVNLTEVREE